MSQFNRSRTVYRSSNHTRSGQNRGGNKGRKGQYIDPARFVKAAKPIELAPYEAIHKFSDFNVHPLIKQNIAQKGFIEPTPIQDQTIALALEGKDIIGIANTGTGKTAAFAIPLINRLVTSPHSKALIIAPTRELAQQIEQDCRWIAKGGGLFGALLIGGSSMGKQLRDLKDRPRVVIGTPGRINDHLERRTLDLSRFDIIVLDEVDRMLDMGFINPVKLILSQMAPRRQSYFFSATLDDRVRGLIDSFAPTATTISLKVGETSENINQDVVRLAGGNKLDKLHDILVKNEVEKSLVFDATQRSVERLSRELIARGFKAESIHGGKSQGQRQRALAKFKNNEVDVLVATDVAARGIDVADITHVINYSLPMSYEDYVHRIGRAGRAGKVGHALTFVD